MTVTESLSQIIRLPGANVLFEAGRGAIGVHNHKCSWFFQKITTKQNWQSTLQEFKVMILLFFFLSYTKHSLIPTPFGSGARSGAASNLNQLHSMHI